jgi:hypothetical protein
MVAARCASYPLSSSDDCASGCSAEHTSYPECRAESDSFYSCIADAGVMPCAAVATDAGVFMQPATSACQAELCARDRCYATAADAAAPTRSCPAFADAAGD